MERLCDDTMSLVLDHLGTNEMLALAQTCKRFKHLVYNHPHKAQPRAFHITEGAEDTVEARVKDMRATHVGWTWFTWVLYVRVNEQTQLLEYRWKDLQFRDRRNKGLFLFQFIGDDSCWETECTVEAVHTIILCSNSNWLTETEFFPISIPPTLENLVRRAHTVNAKNASIRDMEPYGEVFELSITHTPNQNISCLQNIHTLHINEIFRDMDVSVLKNVHTLTLSGASVQCTGISALKRLQSLSLCRVELHRDEDIRALCHIPHLTLRRCTIHGDCRDLLAKWETASPETMRLTNCDIRYTRNGNHTIDGDILRQKLQIIKSRPADVYNVVGMSDIGHFNIIVYTILAIGCFIVFGLVFLLSLFATH